MSVSLLKAQQFAHIYLNLQRLRSNQASCLGKRCYSLVPASQLISSYECRHTCFFGACLYEISNSINSLNLEEGHLLTGLGKGFGLGLEICAFSTECLSTRLRGLLFRETGIILRICAIFGLVTFN